MYNYLKLIFSFLYPHMSKVNFDTIKFENENLIVVEKYWKFFKREYSLDISHFERDLKILALKYDFIVKTSYFRKKGNSTNFFFIEFYHVEFSDNKFNLKGSSNYTCLNQLLAFFYEYDKVDINDNNHILQVINNTLQKLS